MSILLAAALLFAATDASNNDFASRVTQGKLAEASATGPTYQAKLWAKIGNPSTDALKGCIASNAPANKAPFTLISDVQADGKPARIEVFPATPVANCFVGQFATWTLPAPPEKPAPYPIEIDISIVP
ncbi:peptidase C13 [Dyella tabacisoli]|uniref:Peptidase C13 n=1 Tax=Dyella tabacisoli TaxID=2282381 RepID=A0A369UIV8_9GAMM|nr:peptidase C13 [Dyella tabacisoli]RDD80684.1 peptidase C13 [Dyella tabacisoli]